MAVLAICGFESGSSVANRADMIAFTGGTQSIVTSPVRTGTYAWQSNPTTTGTGRVIIRGSAGTGGGLTAWSAVDTYARVYFRYATKPASADEPIIRCDTAANLQKFELRINSSGNLVAYNQAGTSLGTGSATLAQDTWYRIEIRVGTGTSADYEVKVDGTTDLSGTGDLVNTNGGQIQLGKNTNRNGQTVDFFYDDFIASDTGFPGAGAVKILLPTANGSTMQWTAGTGSSDYQEVNEQPVDVADYVQSTAQNDVALFAMTDTSAAGISGTINGIAVLTVAADTTAGTCSFTQRLKSGSTNQDINVGDFNTSHALRAVQVLNADPDTSSAWTTSGLDAIEAGAVDAGTSAIRMSWVAVLVDYTEAAAGETKTATASLDGAIQAAQSATAGLEAAIKLARSASASADAAIEAERTASAGADAAVLAGRSATAGADAAIVAGQAATAGLGAAILAALTAQAALEGAIQAAQSATASIDAFVQTGNAMSASLDAAIQVARSVSASLEAAIQIARSGAAALDAAIQSGRSATAWLDAYVQAIAAITASLDAVVQFGASAIAALDGYIFDPSAASARRQFSVGARPGFTVPSRGSFTVQ